jgi:hypothetical protein
MEGRIAEELSQIKRTLEKSLKSSDSDEKVFDLLNVIEGTQMTAQLIKESKLGKVISSIKDKFKESNPKISEKAISLMVSWKRTIEASQKPDTNASVAKHEKTEHTASIVKPAAAQFNQASSSQDKRPTGVVINALPQARRTIFNILLNTLKSDSCAPEIATPVALRIENSINEAHPVESNNKLYSQKAQTLCFNLKKNEVSILFVV